MTELHARDEAVLVGLDGKKANFIQIGLGTNTTFVQNLAGRKEDWSHTIDLLLSACSEQKCTFVRGVAVEPVPELAAIHIETAAKLLSVVVVQAAIGEEDGPAKIHVLKDPEELLQQVSQQQKESLEWDLACLRNMSSVSHVHPEFEAYRAWILERYFLQVQLVPLDVEQWSWAKLVQKLNFCGCEVLLVDAEGHDASILRSMLAYCKNKPQELPELIQFESRGHCDSFEKRGTELGIIKSLMSAGYQLVAHSHSDTYLVYSPALKREQRLRSWVSDWICDTCGGRGYIPYLWNERSKCCKNCRQIQSGEAKLL